MNIRNNWVLCFLVFALWSCKTVQKGQSADKEKEPLSLNDLPRSIYREEGNFHVQGVVVDVKRGYAYFSFTTSLVKTNLKGELI